MRPNDLGDAPDSTNHFGAAMAAYPGVQAAYPTVFDPATGLPQGPKHLRPRPFHLGPQVSREAEADVGPDDDPINNIMPPANNPDNDRFDDGVNPNLWALNNCQTTNIPVRVFISPQAVNWFQQQDEPAYLNVWLDANRDGDWADGFNCGHNQSEVEHIVIDFPVDVVAIGRRVAHHQRADWVDAVAGAVGPAAILDTRHAQRTQIQQDLDVRRDSAMATGAALPHPSAPVKPKIIWPFHRALMAPGQTWPYRLQVRRGVVWMQQPSGLAAMTAVDLTDQIRFKIDYANLGTRSANGAVLTFQIPTELQGVQPTVLQAPDIPPANISHNNDHISFLLPQIEQENFIILGWKFDSGSSGQPGAYTASAQITLNDDIDLSNNQSETTVMPTLTAPIVAAQVANDKGWSRADSTCRSTVDLRGLGVPGETVTILLDDQPVGTALLGEEPIYFFQLQNLGSGPHHIQARYGAGPTVVSAS